MSIKDVAQKIKAEAGTLNTQEVGLVLIIILVAGSSFGIGRLSARDANKPPITIQTASTFDAVNGAHLATESSQNAAAPAAEGAYVASKNGTKYHLPWCSGAQRIAEKNKIWFATKADAEAAGYTPAANCKGI